MKTCLVHNHSIKKHAPTRSFESSKADAGPEVIKLFSCSTQLSIKFFLLINVKMPTVVGILTFMCGEKSNLGLSDPKKAEFLDIFILMRPYELS